MRITILWQYSDQDEEVGTNHIIDIKRFQLASREPMPPLPNEPTELIDLDDEPLEDHTIAIICEKSSLREEDDNDVETWIDM